jgi:hypothetical protein
MKWFRHFWFWATSYPMRYTGCAFTDIVVGQPVNDYIDRHGKHWMAHHRWAIFRVEREMKQLDKVQTACLKLLVQHGGSWTIDTGWTWQSGTKTEKVLDSLIPRGLVKKLGEHKGYDAYEVTTAGRQHVAPQAAAA